MALVSKDNPGNGQIVEAGSIGRPIGDTSSGAIFVSELPKNFQGGDEALHFALGELFGQYGKIKKIELYMDKGILDTENFKGEALVVYQPSKHTGSHDDGDPVYEACRDMDGKFRVLGHRPRRIKCEPAQWQKEGFNVKERAKKFPCVEIVNLWEYNPTTPMSWFFQVQDAIRDHAAEHIKEPFVKVEPSEGSATIWCKGAQDAMKFAALMQKSYFMGRKVTASLCRREKPMNEHMPKVPKGKLTMKLPGEATAIPEVEGLEPGKLTPELLASLRKQAEEIAAADAAAVEKAAKAAAAAAAAQQEAEKAASMMGPTFLLREGCLVVLKGLVSKPENNGKRGTVVSYVEDVQKYQVRLADDGRFVKLKPENVEAVQDAPPKRIPKALEEEEEDDEDDSANAQAMADAMARGDVAHGPEKPATDGDFEATVCVDPSLLPKKAGEEEEDPEKKRDRSRSRERRRQEQMDAMKARVEAAAKEGKRSSWVVEAPVPSAGNGGAAALAKEPDESREELLKMSVGDLKKMLVKFGKTGRGCLEKKDFVDRLKPPKS
mmetsp:Transcript_19704/g.34968  ORF Transcript_19704/g.34968 Transcript_19704/m.34968 type:complete len:549 (+) Transcript_19704:89-1735(+)|eukprot:CAMPEP_0197627392 /NCGR_PEP_ID=MMETSP1338-20131121/6019_1 /TAXON_ID=43686 ORGANISM="Pelagodinium beii, Strain RCC1491" /NCGR_SAMPLE_ID=MMETSP1338 /ASSEMBLY_ACC=CAM_ASM_000754 /LENGTH=548 /DNA_ID=CAMNT_0043198101 /DNA_START=89 /DNA_END=1735 /DNA_ORIENTATION=+